MQLEINEVSVALGKEKKPILNQISFTVPDGNFVAFARALACEPQVLLLDEPFSGLDELLRDDMRSLILKLHRESNITTLMVTHDAIEALEMADLIVYLEGGRVLQSGAPRDLYEHPAAVEVASCFGDCSTLHGQVRDHVFHCAGFSLPASHIADGAADCVVRFVGVSIDQKPDWVDGGTIPVRCGVYRGAECLTRFDLEGHTLTVPGQTLVPAHSLASVYVDPQNYFVFPA